MGLMDRVLQLSYYHVGEVSQLFVIILLIWNVVEIKITRC